MFRHALLALLLLHGLIHVMGFAKALNTASIPQLTKEVPKSMGAIWMMVTLLFLATAIAYFLQVRDWWILGILSIVLSQILIFTAWQDAKFGTFANVILLVAVVISFFSWRFENEYRRDYKKGLQRTSSIPTRLLTEQDIHHLPTPVQAYLRYVGVLNQPSVNQVHISFKGEMRGKDQDWFSFTSEQYNFFDEPTRLFFMEGKVKGLSTNGYHRYVDQSASMDIRVLSAFPVVQKEDLFQAETVTLFNDMCLLAPATLISDSIQWELIDDLSVKATFTNKGTSITAILYFNDNGQLVNFVSDDRFDIGTSERVRFSTPVKDYRTINGYNLCHYGEAIWHYPEGEFVYGKFHLQDLTYTFPTKREEVDLLELTRFLNMTGIID